MIILEILKIWLPVLSLSGYCFVMKKHFNQRFGFSIILSATAICSISYLFSIIFANIYWPIKFFYLLGLLLFFGFILFEIYLRRKNPLNYSWDVALETIASPSFISFLTISTITYFLFKGSYFHVWDEFSHWGISVKEIYIKNRLFIFDDIENNVTSDLIGYSYPPATSIFFYFFLKNISSQFSESLVYFANSILLILPIYLCFDFLDRRTGGLRKWFQIFITYFAVVFLSVTLLMGFWFGAITNDCCLGLFFGVVAAHSLLYDRSNKRSMIFFNAALFFILFFLSLVKPYGIFLAISTVPLIWLMDLIKYISLSQDKKSFIKINTISTLISIAAILIANLSWVKTIKMSTANQLFQRKIDILALDDVQLKIVSSFANKWFGYFSFPEVKIMITLFLVYWVSLFVKTSSKNDRYKIIGISLYIIGHYLLYSISLMWMYLVKFGEFEALYSASYERYLYTVITGYITLLFALISNIKPPFLKVEFYKFLIKRKLYFRIMLLSLLVIIITSWVYKHIYKNFNAIGDGVIKKIERAWVGGPNFGRDRLVSESKEIMKYTAQGKKVVILFHNFMYPECYVLNYELAPYSSSKFLPVCETLLGGIYASNFPDHPERVILKINSQPVRVFNLMSKSYVEFDIIKSLAAHDNSILFIPRADDELWKNIGYLFGGDYKKSRFFILNSRNKLVPFLI